MSKFRIVNLIDKVFITISIFLIIYAWINFFIRDLNTTFILSLVFTFACVFLLYYFLNKKNSKIQSNRKNILDIEETFLAFRLLPKHEQLNLLNKILSINHEAVIKENNILYKNEQEQVLLITAIDFEKITQNDLINLISKFLKSGIQKIEIICNDYVPNIKLNFVKDLNIKLISKTRLYNEFFLKNNIFPSREKINAKITKLTAKDIAKNFFLPHKSKSYFLCGLVLIFSSIILPYHFYYLISGTLLLVFSIICKILSRINR